MNANQISLLNGHMQALSHAAMACSMADRTIEAQSASEGQPLPGKTPTRLPRPRSHPHVNPIPGLRVCGCVFARACAPVPVCARARCDAADPAQAPPSSNPREADSAEFASPTSREAGRSAWTHPDFTTGLRMLRSPHLSAAEKGGRAPCLDVPRTP